MLFFIKKVGIPSKILYYINIKIIEKAKEFQVRPTKVNLKLS